MPVLDHTDAAPALKEKGNAKWIWFFFTFVLVFILVLYYFSAIKKEFLLLKQVNIYWLIAAVCFQFMTYLFTARVYDLLLKAYKVLPAPDTWDLAKAGIVSLFFNQTVPSAGISGNAFLFNFLLKFKMPGRQILSLIVVELLIFYAAMEILIVSLLLACLLIYRSFYAFKSTLFSGAVVYLAFGLVVIFAGRKNRLDRFLKKIIKTRFFKNMLKNLNRHVADDPMPREAPELSGFMKSNKLTIARAILLQFLLIVADGLTLYVLFLGIAYPADPFIVLLTLICTKIISVIPFLPGALVLYESSMSFFFIQAGIPAGTAIIVTLVYRLLSFWFPIPLGTLLYRRWIKGMAADNTGV